MSVNPSPFTFGRRGKRSGASFRPRDVITRNSPNQPFFFQPLDEPGLVAFRWLGRSYLMSTLKASEVMADIKNAIELAEKP